MNDVKIVIPSQKPIQSSDVGSTPTVRKKRSKELGTIKAEVKAHLDKLSNGLRV